MKIWKYSHEWCAGEGLAYCQYPAATRLKSMTKTMKCLIQDGFTSGIQMYGTAPN